jgi:acyl-CoA thioesterase FadM
MNLFFRLLLSLFYSSRQPKIALTGIAHLPFRIYRFDCDLNGHLTNSKYLSFMDLGRVSFLQQIGLFNYFYKKSWFPVLQSVDLTFIKQILPGYRVMLTTQLLGIDEKYLYLEQKFLVNGELKAIGRVRGVFVGREGTIPMHEIKTILPGELPILPPSLDVWKTYLIDKKNETT